MIPINFFIPTHSTIELLLINCCNSFVETPFHDQPFIFDMILPQKQCPIHCYHTLLLSSE